MIKERNAKEYCCEDISKIENYEQAIVDDTQSWDLHHRREIDEHKSARQLIKEGLYYKRPADELIFLTHNAHTRLHMQGENHPMFGKHLSNEHRKNLSEALQGRQFSDEHRKKLSEALTNNPKRLKPVQQLDKATGEVLATFPSIKEAERVTGVTGIAHICKCCLGPAGGFKWRYA